MMLFSHVTLYLVLNVNIFTLPVMVLTICGQKTGLLIATIRFKRNSCLSIKFVAKKINEARNPN